MSDALGSLTSFGADADDCLRMVDLTKIYGDTVAVQSVNLSIKRGEIFALLGSSGCGKSTLLRMLAGFETVTSGQIFLEGEDITQLPPYKRPINMMFQSYALFPHMTVEANVAFGLKQEGVVQPEIHERVFEALELVQMSPYARRKPHQLSGGQQQRVALARALVNYPSALLLDEPLGALDLKLRQAMQIELKRIQREVGITFVYVTHDQEEALTMSDRIAVMYEGHVEQIGSPQEIYHSPASVFVAGFIGVANLLPVNIDSISGANALIQLPGGNKVSLPIGSLAPVVGGAATIMVRPERIFVATAEPEGDLPHLKVSVTDLTFQGPIVRASVRCADGTELVTHIGDGDDLPILRPNDHLWLTWELEAAKLLPGVDERHTESTESNTALI